jgi:hypothetical protein
MIAWRRRREFRRHPYWHWFVYLHLTAVGLHQFEEYGWPGGFREAFMGVIGSPAAAGLIPPSRSLEALNVFALLPLFGLAGWVGTRFTFVGLGLLFVNFSNAFFHIVESVARMQYVPGAVTGGLLYLPLGLLAARHAVLHRDIGVPGLLASFLVGLALSLAPFIHVWALSPR